MKPLEDRLRELGDSVSQQERLELRPTSRALRRIRVGRAARSGAVLAAVATLAIGGFNGARSLSNDDAAPVRPAEEGMQETEPMRNGRIVQADTGGYWRDDTAPPPPPAGDKSYHWDSFDQDDGLFLYAQHSREGRVWVVGEDGLVAEPECPPSSSCGNEIPTFGPGPDEITVPSVDGVSAHVIGFDGTPRDTLDISAAGIATARDLRDLAWSPDGNRLAVSTGDRCTPPCQGRVWIFDRDGGEPQLVYTERDTRYAALRDLAWSADGDTLALLVAPPTFCESGEQTWPRLVALRVAPNEPVQAETLYVYDDYGVENVCVVPDDYHIAFPFGWSPDGTRVAVTSGDGILELSAENGEVVARHPGEGPEGPLAWLPKR
jgi:hypothetical protein